MVAVGGNGGSSRAAEYLGEIALLMPGIGAGDKDAANCVLCSMPESPLALLEETRILAEQGRQNSPVIKFSMVPSAKTASKRLP
jgi:hypothetical protein